MAIIELQLRQGPEAQRTLLTPLEGEMIYITDNKHIYVGDGATAGGNALRAPLPAQGTADNSDHVASTKFVQMVVQNITGTNLSDYARRALPNVFTDLNTFNVHPIISATQLATTDSSQRAATTQWVQSLLTGAGLGGNYAVRNQSNTFTGLNDFTLSPTVPTPAINDNSTKVATTAFVKSSMSAAGLGVSTVIVSGGAGASVNYSAGQVTLPNGTTVAVSAGNLSFPANGTFYMIVDGAGLVSQAAAYPSGNDKRVIATVTTSSGAITSVNLGGSDLSAYAKLDGATFSGTLRSPNPLDSANDTITATTKWVNDKLSNTGDPNIVRETTNNTYAGSTTQDFTAGTILVPPQAPTDDSNKAASTSFVQDVLTAALTGGANLSQFARLDGATFTGPTSGLTPPANDDSNRFATTQWVNDETDDIRTLLDRILIGGDVFPTLTIRANTRILDYTAGVVRLASLPTACLISPENIELPANATVWIYIDPTCGVNHYPFSSVLTKPPTGKAFAYATTNATTVTSVTLLPPETLLKGDVAIQGNLTIGGTLSSSANIPNSAGTNANGSSWPVPNDDRFVTAEWVRMLSQAQSPIGGMMIWPFDFEPYAANMISGQTGSNILWSICDGKFTSAGWVIRDIYGMINLPDLRDTFIRGANSSQGRTPYTGGGSNVAALNNFHLPPHAHNFDHYHDVPQLGHNHTLNTNELSHAHLLGKGVRSSDLRATGNQRYMYDVGMDQFNDPGETNDFTTTWDVQTGNPNSGSRVYSYVPPRGPSTTSPQPAGNTVFITQTGNGQGQLHSNGFTSATGSGAAFSIVPQHVNMHFIMRVN